MQYLRRSPQLLYELLSEFSPSGFPHQSIYCTAHYLGRSLVITLRATSKASHLSLKQKENKIISSATPLRAAAVPHDVMAAGVAKLQLSTHPFNHLGSRGFTRSDRRPRLSSDPRRSPAMFDGVSFLGPLLCRITPLLPCRSFRSENGEESSERDGKMVPDRKRGHPSPRFWSGRKGALYSLKSLLIRVSGTWKAVYIGRL